MTPRTDAAERECCCTVNGAVINGVVTANFARTIERELAAAQEQLRAIISAYDAYRGRGVAPAPAEYADVVAAINAARRLAL